MGRAPCCEKESVKRGPWTPEEDAKLLSCVAQHGTGSWRTVPKKAGLQRCGKSCRLRWTNYLRPDLKHGRFSDYEEQTIVRLHAALGSRWSLIAAQLPGRTDNDVKNYWNTRLKKKLCEMGIDPITHKPISQLLADLAGSMAMQQHQPPQSSASSASALPTSGRTIAEAALGCFKDEMLNVMMRRNQHPPVINAGLRQQPNSSPVSLSLSATASAPPPDHLSSLSLSTFQQQQRPPFANVPGTSFYSSQRPLITAADYAEHEQLVDTSKPLMHMLMESTAPVHHHIIPPTTQYDFSRPSDPQMRSNNSSFNPTADINSHTLSHLPMTTSPMTFSSQMQQQLHTTPTTTTATTSTSATSASTDFSTLSLSQSAEKFLRDNPIAAQPWPQLIPDDKHDGDEEEEEEEEGGGARKRDRSQNNNMMNDGGGHELDHIVLEHHWGGNQQHLDGNDDEDDEISQLPQYSASNQTPITYSASTPPTSFHSHLNNTGFGPASSSMSWSSCPSSRSSSSCSNFLPSAPSNSHDACINNYSHLSSSNSEHKYSTNDSSSTNPSSSLVPSNDPSVDAMIWDLSDLNALI